MSGAPHVRFDRPDAGRDVSGAQRRSENLGSLGDHLLADGLGFLGGQRVVGGAQAQGKGQRTVALRYLVTLVDIEESDRLGELAGALANDLLDARGGNVGRNDQGDILLGQRERRDALDLDRIGGHVRDQRVHVDLEGARARGQAEGAAGGGRGGFDEKTATLSGSFKGRGIGDCWSGNAAVWDGKTFVRSEEHTTGSCKGFTGGAWLMPIFEARVER